MRELSRIISKGCDKGRGLRGHTTLATEEAAMEATTERSKLTSINRVLRESKENAAGDLHTAHARATWDLGLRLRFV